jgi:hypothetical protein
MTAEKRNELNRRTIRGATHDAGIFIGALFAADRLLEVGFRFPVTLKSFIDKLCEIWSRSPVGSVDRRCGHVSLASYYPSQRLDVDEVPRKGTCAR